MFLRGGWPSRCLALLPLDAADLDDRRRNTVAGLASSLRLAGTGTQEPLWDRLGMLTMPVLVLAGERDERSRPRPSHRDTIGSNATFAVVPCRPCRAPGGTRGLPQGAPRLASTSGAQGQAEREERAEAELQATGLGQDADQLRPAAPLRTRLIGPTARVWRRAPRPRANATRSPRQCADEGQRRQRLVERRVGPSPMRTARVRLPAARSVGDVAQVVDHEQRAGQRRPALATNESPGGAPRGRRSPLRVATRPKNTNTKSSPNP